MRKLIVPTIILVFVLAGCITAQPDRQQPFSPAEVKLKIEGVKAVQVSPGTIQKVTKVPSYLPELTNLSQIIGDTAYFTLWGGISSSDALSLWRDCNIFRQKGIKNLHVYINSGGGSAFDGMGIATMFAYLARTRQFNITVEASGLVASAAVPIFVVAPYRIAAKGTIFMIHNAKLWKFLTQEEEKDLIAQQKMLEIERKRYTKLLADHSKLTQEQVEKMCQKTTWFTVEQAKKWGMVDEIR